jgi:type II secretory pathway component GspD/PulD (secretin)
LTSNVQTVITVPDQRTIILGGLEKLNQTKGGIKVPILGDIPIVGGLFRNVANTDSQNRLYIFVKANVLRPETKINEESDIVKISHKGREEFEKYESEMQKYEDWPGIKPKPMDPNKILEKD